MSCYGSPWTIAAQHAAAAGDPEDPPGRRRGLPAGTVKETDFRDGEGH